MRLSLQTKLCPGLLVILAFLAGFFWRSAQASVLWQADTNLGTSVFEGIEEAPGTIALNNDPQGKYGIVYCYRLWDDTHYAKERVESRGTETPNGPFQMSYGQDYYIGWRAMWGPMPVTPGWVALFQMKGYGVTGQGAPLVLRCVDGDGNLYLQNNANGVNTNFWHMPFKTNVWQSFVIHTLLSTNHSQGYIELWVDGVPQKFNNGQTRWYGPTWDNVDGTWQNSYNRVKWGCYRSPAMNGKGPASAFMCNAKIGTTYADVDADGGTIATPAPPPKVSVSPGKF